MIEARYFPMASGGQFGARLITGFTETDTKFVKGLGCPSKSYEEVQNK
jgi:hypothetical protein